MPVSKQRKKKSSGGAGKPQPEGYGGVLTLIALVTVLGGGTWLIMGGWSGKEETVSVTLPTLSAKAAEGHKTFKRTCAACHGENAQGTTGGPPLIHVTYRANHHGDHAIRLAVTRGTRQHHWSFGNMPPQPQVKAGEIDAIIAFVRETQRANGIR